MINVVPYIRKGLVSALVVSYGDALVPVFENEGAGGNLEVHLMDTQAVDNNTKNNFGWIVTQVIEVVSVQQTSSRKTVDAVGGLIMNILKPTIRSTGVTLDNSLQLVHAKVQSQNYLTEDSGSSNKIVRLIIKYEFKIIER